MKDPGTDQGSSSAKCFAVRASWSRPLSTTFRRKFSTPVAVLELWTSLLYGFYEQRDRDRERGGNFESP